MNLKIALITILLFLTTNLCGCSLLLSPITPFMANSLQSKHSKKLRETPPEIIVIENYQLASVKKIAVMPFENLISDDKVITIPFFPKDWGVSGAIVLSNKRAGHVLSEFIEEGFLKLRVVDVVERSRLKFVIQEQAILQSGLGGEIIPEIAGATAGADAILVGAIVTGAIYFPDRSMVKHSSRLYVKTRLIDARNGKILMTLTDRQSRISYNPDEVYLIYDDISKRVADSICETIKIAREANPNAKPPEKAEFLSDNKIQ